MDVVQCGNTAGTDIIVWDWLDNDCQRLYFDHLGDGWYRITPKTNSNLALQVEGCGGAWSDVRLGAWSNSACQWSTVMHPT